MRNQPGFPACLRVFLPGSKGRTQSTARGAFSLIEMLAVSTLIGIVALVVLARFSNTGFEARRSACYTHKGDIEVEVQRWFRDKGSWPSATLSDIGADVNYFPEGLPICPVDGTGYVLDPTTHFVAGHVHNTP